jgi:hypothetical protein
MRCGKVSEWMKQTYAGFQIIANVSVFLHHFREVHDGFDFGRFPFVTAVGFDHVASARSFAKMSYFNCDNLLTLRYLKI